MSRNLAPEILAEDYIEKLVLLERQLGATTSYRILDPFPLKPHNSIELQGAAKRIARFVGLEALTFIVGTAEQEQNVAAHIDLHPLQTEVFIELSPSSRNFPRAVLATLAHEVAHKYLQLKAITVGAGPVHTHENEVLTDIATIFLGLGKLMLNGCECQHADDHSGPAGTPSTVETLTTGYLARRQLAFVYLLVCAARSIPQSEYLRALAPDAIRSVRECAELYRPYFDAAYGGTGLRKQLVADLRGAIAETQEKLADLEKNLSYVHARCPDVVGSFLTKVHKRLMMLMLASQTMAGENEHDPALRYFRGIQLHSQTANLRGELRGYGAEAERCQAALLKVASCIRKHGAVFPEPTGGPFTRVTCRNDGTKLRLPANKGALIANCPTCGYSFVVDTSPAGHSAQGSHKRGSIFARILSWARMKVRSRLFK